MTNDEMLTPEEAAAYLHTTENSLRWMRSKGKGPPYRKPDCWRIFYKRSDLDAYHAACGPSARKKRMDAAIAEAKRGPAGLDNGGAP